MNLFWAARGTKDLAAVTAMVPSREESEFRGAAHAARGRFILEPLSMLLLVVSPFCKKKKTPQK
jgi:hypothetical protein